MDRFQNSAVRKVPKTFLKIGVKEMTNEQKRNQLRYSEQDRKEVEETKSDILTAIMQAPSIDKMINVVYEKSNIELEKKCELFEDALEELAKDNEQFQDLLNMHLDITEEYKKMGFKSGFSVVMKIIQQTA